MRDSSPRHEESRDTPEPDPRRGFARSSFVFGRLLGAVFLVAFASFHLQMEGLIGERGIEPATELVRILRERGLPFSDYPTLAWIVGASDAALHATCLLGELVSIALLLGVFPGAAALVCSILYLSLVVLGGTFMAFQWDALLVETGLLAALMLPWQPVHRARECIEPPALARWAVYLLLFRLMFLSGVVKLASRDPAWSSLTALEYHYWTQPLPNPASWLVHQMPDVFHRVSTFLAIGGELVLPFAILLGWRGRRVAFVGLSLLMATIALTGNYGYFNLLSFALAVPLLDDEALSRLTLRRLDARLVASRDRLPRWRSILRRIAAVPVAILVAVGVVVVLRTMGARVLPDVALDAADVASSYRAVNGYGLFAVMTRVRREIRIEGSLDGREWREYRFAHKPGDPTEIPGISAPHMPRLDWQMWFAALGSSRDSPWLSRFLRRLLEAEPDVLALLDHDPFEGRPPRYVRAVLYDYTFGDVSLLADEGRWWRVEELGPYTNVLGR